MSTINIIDTNYTDSDDNENADVNGEEKTKISTTRSNYSAQSQTPTNCNNVIHIILSTPILSSSNKKNRWTLEEITACIGQKEVKSTYISQLLLEERSSGYNWYNAKSCHLSKRREIIDWLCILGTQFVLHKSTIYQGIYYFDKLCSQHEINVMHSHMVGITCLMIAMKWSEKEEKTPPLRCLAHLCNHEQNKQKRYELNKTRNDENVNKTNNNTSNQSIVYLPHHFKNLELKILNLLNWNLKIALPIDFIEYYIFENVVFSDDCLDGHCNLQNHPQAKIYMKKYCIFFLDIACQEYCFWKYSSSVLAAVIIVASRRALCITPFWNTKLTNVLEYSFDTLESCFENLWKLYHTRFPVDALRAESVHIGNNKITEQ